MSVIIFLSWIILNTSLLNIAIKTGWNFDPGYIGPLIIIFILNLTSAIYASPRRNTNK